MVARAFRLVPPRVPGCPTSPLPYQAAGPKGSHLLVFLTYDVSENEELARRLKWALAAAVLLFGLLSLALGIWSTSRVMAPVTELARRLEAMDEHAPDTDLARQDRKSTRLNSSHVAIS